MRKWLFWFKKGDWWKDLLRQGAVVPSCIAIFQDASESMWRRLALQFDICLKIESNILFVFFCYFFAIIEWYYQRLSKTICIWITAMTKWKKTPIKFSWRIESRTEQNYDNRMMAIIHLIWKTWMIERGI